MSVETINKFFPHGMTEEAFRIYFRQQLRVLTTAAFCKSTGLSKSYVQMVASGKRPPSERVLKAFKLHKAIRYVT